jgi:hypothetical protein
MGNGLFKKDNPADKQHNLALYQQSERNTGSAPGKKSGLYLGRSEFLAVADPERYHPIKF